jgi:hypothetical protein
MSETPEYIEKLTLLPAHMRGGMQRWIEHGHNSRPSSFLSAVLSNDLMDALGRADDINSHALPAYATYLYNYAPSGCFGSKAKFEAWRGLLAEQRAEQAA